MPPFQANLDMNHLVMVPLELRRAKSRSPIDDLGNPLAKRRGAIIWASDTVDACGWPPPCFTRMLIISCTIKTPITRTRDK